MADWDKTLLPHTKWEKMQKKSFQSKHKPLQKAVEEGKEKGYEFDPFTQDLFGSLYQLDPQFPEETTPGKKWHKKALDVMQELREYKDIRNAGTICDSFQSGLGATVMADHFAKELPKMEKPNPDDVQRQMNAYQDLIDNHPDHPKTKEMEKRVKNLQEQLKESSKEWEEAELEDQAIRIAMRGALNEARQAISDADENARAYGYGLNPGEDGYSDPTMKLQVAEMIKKKPKLKQIAEMAGRFRREARAVQSQKKVPGHDELTDIETGADLGQLIPSELLKLNHPLLRLEFAKKMLERNLIQYRLESIEKESRGPIVVCIDNSGSMMGAKEIWSKGIALAMCQIAIDQKRTFEIIHFDTEVKKKEVFPAGKTDVMRLIDCISYFSNGGTKFAPPLGEAFKDIVEAKEKDLSKADVIFITDGEAPLDKRDTETINAAKKVTEASLFTICLGSMAKSLEPVSDSITYLSDLNNDEEVKEIIFSI